MCLLGWHSLNMFMEEQPQIHWQFTGKVGKIPCISLQWRHNERDGISNHQPQDCLLNRLFRRRSKKTSKLRVTGLCVGNSTVTGEFPAQRASNAEIVSIWWRHHVHRRCKCSMHIYPAKIWYGINLYWIRSHYSDVIMSAMASQITGVSVVCLFSHRSKKASKVRVTVCEGNSPVIGEFPEQGASYAENISMWWRHHVILENCKIHSHYTDVPS